MQKPKQTKIVKIGNREFEVNYAVHYKNRQHPIGQLTYKVEDPDKLWRGALLEYGEEEFIYDVPRLVGGGNLINLGDDGGGSAILLAQGLRDQGLNGHVYTVDNYSDAQANRARRFMEQAGVSEKITLLHMRTDEASDKLTDTYPFVFIDADHSFEGTQKDWDLYSLKIKKGGIVAFHDTNQTGINNVIETISSKEWELIHWVNRIKAYKKL